MEPVRKSPTTASHFYVHWRVVLAGLVLSGKSRPEQSLFPLRDSREKRTRGSAKAKITCTNMALKRDARVKPPSIEPALVH